MKSPVCWSVCLTLCCLSFPLQCRRYNVGVASRAFVELANFMEKQADALLVTVPNIDLNNLPRIIIIIIIIIIILLLLLLLFIFCFV